MEICNSSAVLRALMDQMEPGNHQQIKGKWVHQIDQHPLVNTNEIVFKEKNHRPIGTLCIIISK
jgi:hypothetical protein